MFQLSFAPLQITTSAYVNIQQIVRDTVTEIGYTRGKFGFDADNLAVMVSLDEQSDDIAIGVNRSLERRELVTTDYNEIGAGDQGLMFGFDQRNGRTDAFAYFT